MDAEMHMASMGSKNAMIELAKEELQILEFQHPNKFHCLKQELKALISDFENQKLLLNSSPAAATQGNYAGFGLADSPSQTAVWLLLFLPFLPMLIS